jgi:hypothetical protein
LPGPMSPGSEPRPQTRTREVRPPLRPPRWQQLQRGE